MGRFEYKENKMDDCIELFDEEDELKSDYNSNIVLYPLDDSITVVDYLNTQSKIIARLTLELTYNDYEDENIKEIIDEIKED
ncbi:hypothetical protein [Methanobrevibacter sp.]|uniref:hypothetical protein n=1 Tax=Methanobrevibacter sp. TaxID=66852 RepID=UPI00386FD9F1